MLLIVANIDYHMQDEKKIREKLQRILDRVINVIENGGEIEVEDPRATLFMQADNSGVTVSTYTVVYEKEAKIIEEKRTVKIDVVIEANQCFAFLSHDPYTGKTFWSINVGAPFKMKSTSGERWGKKYALIDIVKE